MAVYTSMHQKFSVFIRRARNSPVERLKRLSARCACYISYTLRIIDSGFDRFFLWKEISLVVPAPRVRSSNRLIDCSERSSLIGCSIHLQLSVSSGNSNVFLFSSLSVVSILGGLLSNGSSPFLFSPTFTRRYVARTISEQRVWSFLSIRVSMRERYPVVAAEMAETLCQCSFSI